MKQEEEQEEEEEELDDTVWTTLTHLGYCLHEVGLQISERCCAVRY
jgi:hypothetical protein